MVLGKHKQYIVEWGSVSSDVIKASTVLSKKIWKDSYEKLMYYSWDESKPYVEGEFEFDFSTVGFDIDIPFLITYTIYMADTKEQYDALFENVNGDESANSSTDFENHRLNIVSGMIGGHPSPDFLSNVMHEVDHVFEYMKGYKKDNTLYDNVIQGINSKNQFVKAVSMLMYYCFKHEQDAFVHQFYGALFQNKYEGDFEHALFNFSEYRNLLQIKITVLHNLNMDEVIKACKELGTSIEHVSRFSAYIAKKMKNKLFKAYKRYCTITRKIMPEGIIHQNGTKRMLFVEYQERYKNMKIKKEKYIEEL